MLTAHCPNIYTVRQRRFRAHTRYITYVHILNTDAESLDTRRSKTKAFACKKEKKNTTGDTLHSWAKQKKIPPEINALSFYVTKTDLVGSKWFWSDQIDLDLTIMIWSQPK